MNAHLSHSAWRAGRGKWSNLGVPHKGWRCVDIEELEEHAICDMCETAESRYAHHMRHSDFSGILRVGCQCAERLRVVDFLLGGIISVMAGYVVAPGITSDKYNDSMRLEAFEQRCLQWVLRQATRLTDDDESGLAILMLATSVMEPMGAILRSHKTDKAEFAEGFAYLFQKIKGSDNAYKVGECAFDLLRSGLYHEAFIKRGLAIEHQGEAVELRDGAIIINPRTFLRKVEEGFLRFCEDVRKDTGLSANFHTYFKKLDQNADHKMTETAFTYNGQGTAAFSGPAIEFKK